MLRASAFLLLAVTSFAAELPRGQIIDAVPCLADATQSYALYLPSNYSPQRRWNVILAFDAGGRGRMPVERFQAAAEKYGYIVAGSLNSRNGPLNVSVAAGNAMWKDVEARFSVDKTRLYTTGQSGGSRVAMYLAMHRDAFSDAPAGVIASSAGFPGPDAPESLPFPVFATAGTEDFNHLEMRQFDQHLQSRHRLAIFDGGHAAEIDAIFAARVQSARESKEVAARYLAMTELASDFNGLKDVKEFMAEAARLQKDHAVQAAFERDTALDEREDQLSGTLLELAAQLRYPSRRAKSMEALKTSVAGVSAAATAPADSAERQMSRRVLRGIEPRCTRRGFPGPDGKTAQ